MKECWEVLPTEAIQKSFRACGISGDVEGENDSGTEIHSLKDGGVATAARATVTSATAWLLSRADGNGNEDPFAELGEDDNELNEIETVMEDSYVELSCCHVPIHCTVV